MIYWVAIGYRYTDGLAASGPTYGKPPDQSLGRLSWKGEAAMWIKYIGRVIVNTGLFFVIFATLSITGVLVEDMQWKWAVEKWAYVFEGGLRADQLRKKMDNSKFPKGSYEKYINPHTNGNLAASDEVSACVFKDQIYLAIPDNLIIIKRIRKNKKGSAMMSPSQP